MSNGITLSNNQGQIMFSTEYMAFHFVGKFTAVAPSGFVCQATFSCNGTPIVFLNGSSGSNVVGILELKDNGSGSWTAFVAGRTLANVGLTSIEIYVFAFPTAAATDGYGMWAKNSSGTTTFNFSQRVLKISGALQTIAQSSSVSDTPPNQSITFGSIPTDYIVCAPMLGEIISPAGANSLLLGVGPYRVNSSTVGLFATNLYTPFGPPRQAYRIYEQEYVLFADKSLYQ